MAVAHQLQSFIQEGRDRLHSILVLDAAILRQRVAIFFDILR